MKIVMFYHSLISDWNHGNAHFLRGIVTELLDRGHDVKVYEPVNGWSLSNLIQDNGKGMVKEFGHYYPSLTMSLYDPENPDYEDMLRGAYLVIAHEWNKHELVAKLGAIQDQFGYKLVFHDTHHRAVSDPASMSQYDFSNYDGALVFGDVLKDIYKKNKWIDRVWTWHEAADTTLFRPHPEVQKEGDLVWIGNWGDDERTEELMEYLIRPVKELGLKAKVYGVRYPEHALTALKDAGIEYGGWLPNYKVPEVFAKYKVTVHVPRGPYVKWLPGIPTIRPFEAMACGIPLISSPWEDAEGLFTPGLDFLVANNGQEMKAHLQQILNNEAFAKSLAEKARLTVLSRHTCSHRVNELENILGELGFADRLVYPVKTKTIAV